MQVSETKEFRRSYYWAIDSAAGFRVMKADGDTSKPSYNLFGVLLHPGSPEDNVVASSSLSFNSPDNDTTNLSANDFIFPNDQSQQKQQQKCLYKNS